MRGEKKEGNPFAFQMSSSPLLTSICLSLSPVRFFSHISRRKNRLEIHDVNTREKSRTSVCARRNNSLIIIRLRIYTREREYYNLGAALTDTRFLN